MIDNVGNLIQARQDVFRGLYLRYSLRSRPHSPLASRMNLGTTVISARHLEEKLSFQMTMLWYAWNCVEPSMS